MKTPEEMLALRKAKRDEISQADAESLKQSMSVQERLERKFETDIVEVEMGDDLGRFSLKFKKLSPIQQDELGALVSTAGTTTLTKEEKEAADDKLYAMIASASRDGITAEFWKKKTGYSTGDFVTIITKLVSASGLPDQKYLEEINKFRR